MATGVAAALSMVTLLVGVSESLLPVVTVVSVLVLVRSGTWLSDMQFELH